MTEEPSTSGSSSVADLAPLPARSPEGHKGTFGTLAVIGGCAHRQSGDSPGSYMIGAPALAALAALRTGVGLVRLVTPEPILAACLTMTPGATGIPLPVDDLGRPIPHLAAAAVDHALASAHCVAVGPGLGVGEGATAITLRCLGQSACPVIVDADGINCLASITRPHLDVQAPAILTPHPGEFRRLASALGIGAETSPAPAAAARLARSLGCVVVLKGAQTAVSDGIDTWVHDRPNPVLATAGSGDVLTGVIGALAAWLHPRDGRGGGEGMSLYDIARYGVIAHAAAAEGWRVLHGASGGLLATDLVGLLPATVEGLVTGRWPRG